MKSIIVEDEYRGREVLSTLLKTYCPEITVAAMAQNIRSAYSIICSLRPDLVFLDIEMPDGTGFDLLKKFDQPKFKTIFVTSYDQYAIQAIKFHAFDYLLKPVLVEELKAAVGNFLEEVQGNNDLASNCALPKDGLLEINHKTKLDYAKLNDIILLKGDGNYTFIYTTGGKNYHTSRTLKDYEELLCNEHSDFVRTHKSTIVNLRFVRDFVRGPAGGLVLTDGTIIQVSRRKKEEVLAKIKLSRGYSG